MNCPNCGYEIKKANQKKCPLCGEILVREEIKNPPVESSLTEEEPKQPEISTMEEQPHEEETLQASYQNLCPRCHAPMPATGKFCPNCGFDIRTHVEPEPMVAQPVVPHIPQPEPVVAPQPAYVPQQTYHPELVPQPQRESVSEPQPQPIPVYTPQPQSAPIHEAPVFGDDQDPTFLDEESGYVNGGYYPYPEDVDNQNTTGEDVPSSQHSSSTWLIILLTIIGSLLLGVLLYFITQ